MTYKERLQIEHPECIEEKEEGGCKGCPEDYGYTDKYCKDGRRMCDDWYDFDVTKQLLTDLNRIKQI